MVILDATGQAFDENGVLIQKGVTPGYDQGAAAGIMQPGVVAPGQINPALYAMAGDDDDICARCQ